MAKKSTSNVKCSFCGKMQDEVERIVAGPGVYICNECIDVCSNIVENDIYEDEDDEKYTINNETVPTPKEIKDVLTSMYNELKQRHQIYVVAPLIEESDKIDLKNVYDLEEKFNKAFGKICNIDILHGKMKPSEKEEVMQKFKENKINILISTTVIEVGVDVKNATMMVIFDAERFGLSALHQLRGRVGRNNLQSYCI